MNVLRQRGEDGTQVEEFVLHAFQLRGQITERGMFFGSLPGCAGEGVQLIDHAVAIDAWVVLGGALTADQAGLAGISAPGIYPIDGQPGLIKSLCHESSISSLTQN